MVLADQFSKTIDRCGRNAIWVEAHNKIIDAFLSCQLVKNEQEQIRKQIP
ncbi:hypothetical protein LguiA_019875 [Lonicera macranthoides]